MDAEQNDNPQLPDTLGSAEYRTRLTTKLNCLIAVLEVAIAKITKSMDTPGANEDRLTKIRGNLENTLTICHRSKQTLDRTQKKREITSTSGANRDMTARDYVELTSIEEYRKFRNMAPISRNELETIDFDELSRRLSDS